MQACSGDQQDYAFLTAVGASVDARLVANRNGGQTLELAGNRAGLLSLANILLWLYANTWRREFLALGELPFVHCAGSLSIHLRITDSGTQYRWGCLNILDQGAQLEWELTDGELMLLALNIHDVVCAPGKEYTRNLMREGSTLDAVIRMTDAREWMEHQYGHREPSST